MKPCKHDISNKTCRLCWLFDNRPDYRQLWGGDPESISQVQSDTFTDQRRASIAEIKRRISFPCIHLGEILEVKPSCGCGARHVCAKHGECVKSGSAAKWRSCSSCPDYLSADLGNNNLA